MREDADVHAFSVLNEPVHRIRRPEFPGRLPRVADVNLSHALFLRETNDRVDGVSCFKDMRFGAEFTRVFETGLKGFVGLARETPLFDPDGEQLAMKTRGCAHAAFNHGLRVASR